MNAKNVLITGASSGIGYATAVALDKKGYKVFATVRHENDAKKLSESCSSQMEPLIFDVVDFQKIEEIGKQLSQKLATDGLFALINNAGVGDYAPIESLSIEKMKQVFDINFFGPLKLTQVLIPLLRITKGRIINLCSIGGIITIPYASALCTSKHALESLTDGLRLELAPWGIHSIAINPTGVVSAAAEKMIPLMEENIKKLTPEQQNLYAHSLRKMVASMYLEEAKGVLPEKVAEVVIEALEAKKPKARYAVGSHAELLTILSGILSEDALETIESKILNITS